MEYCFNEIVPLYVWNIDIKKKRRVAFAIKVGQVKFIPTWIVSWMSTAWYCIWLDHVCIFVSSDFQQCTYKLDEFIENNTVLRVETPNLFIYFSWGGMAISFLHGLNHRDSSGKLFFFSKSHFYFIATFEKTAD